VHWTIAGTTQIRGTSTTNVHSINEFIESHVGELVLAKLVGLSSIGIVRLDDINIVSKDTEALDEFRAVRDLQLEFRHVLEEELLVVL
jgi:hypothetical protein